MVDATGRALKGQSGRLSEAEARALAASVNRTWSEAKGERRRKGASEVTEALLDRFDPMRHPRARAGRFRDVLGKIVTDTRTEDIRFGDSGSGVARLRPGMSLVGKANPARVNARSISPGDTVHGYGKVSKKEFVHPGGKRLSEKLRPSNVKLTFDDGSEMLSHPGEQHDVTFGWSGKANTANVGYDTPFSPKHTLRGGAWEVQIGPTADGKTWIAEYHSAASARPQRRYFGSEAEALHDARWLKGASGYSHLTA